MESVRSVPTHNSLSDTTMKQIPLTQGKFALVDDSDYQWLNRWKWYAQHSHGGFRAVRRVNLPNGKRPLIHMSREILGLRSNDRHVADHINHNSCDNRRVNLRSATPRENSRNRNLDRTKGYHRDRASGKYKASIMVRGKPKHLGLWNTPAMAHHAYVKAKLKYHKIRSVA